MSDLPDIKQKYGVDTTDFKTGMAAMAREVRLLNSEFKASAAQLGDWGSSATGLEKRIETLNKLIGVQQDRVAAARAEYERLAKEKGENSVAAKNMQIALNKEVEALGKMQSELDQTEGKLGEMRSAADKAGDEIGDLKKDTDKAGGGADDLRRSSDRLEGGLKALSGAVKSVGSALKSAVGHAASFGSAVGRAAASTVSAVGRMAVNITKLGLAAAGLGIAAAAGVGGLLASTIGPASDLQETANKIGVVFGDVAGQIQEFAAGSALSLGQTRQAALDAAATFGVFGKSAGLSGNDLAGFSTNLVSLSSDLASFYNTSPEQAIEAIGAALRGESEPIRQYGVLLDDATLRQKAFELGIISTTKEALTPAQKVLASYNVILDQTKDAQGDFGRTSDGLANQQRILTAQFENLKTVIGPGLLPLVTQLYRMFNEFLASPAVQQGAQALSDRLLKLSETIGGLLDRSAEGGGLTGMFAAFQNSAIGQTIGEVIGYFKELFQILTGSGGDVEKIGEGLGGLISRIVENLLASRGRLIETGMSLLTGLVDGITEAIPRLLPIAERIITKLADFVVTTLPKLLEIGAKILTSLIQGIVPQLPMLVKAAFDIIRTLIDFIIANLPMLIGVAVDILLTLVKGILENLPMIVEAGIEALLALIEGLTEALPELIPAIVEAILLIDKVIIEHLPEIVEAGGKLLLAIVEGLAEALPMLIEATPELIQALVDAMFELLPVVAQIGWEIIKAIAKMMIDNLPALGKALLELPQILNDATGKIMRSLWDIGGNIIDGVWQGIVDRKDQFFERIKNFFRGTVDAANDGIDAHSPSRLFENVGENAGSSYLDSLGAALKGGARQLERAFSETALTLKMPQPFAPAYASAAGAMPAGDTYNVTFVNTGQSPASVESDIRKLNMLYGK